MLEKLVILFPKGFRTDCAKSLVKAGFLMIFVTLTRLEAFGNKCWAGFVNYGKKWVQYHKISQIRWLKVFLTQRKPCYLSTINLAFFQYFLKFESPNCSSNTNTIAHRPKSFTYRPTLSRPAHTPRTGGLSAQPR